MALMCHGNWQGFFYYGNRIQLLQQTNSNIYHTRECQTGNAHLTCRMESGHVRTDASISKSPKYWLAFSKRLVRYVRESPVMCLLRRKKDGWAVKSWQQFRMYPTHWQQYSAHWMYILPTETKANKTLMRRQKSPPPIPKGLSAFLRSLQFCCDINCNLMSMLAHHIKRKDNSHVARTYY